MIGFISITIPGIRLSAPLSMVDVLFMYEILIIQIWCQVCQVVIVSRTMFTLTLVSQGPLNLFVLVHNTGATNMIKNTLCKFIDQLDTQLHSTDIRNKRVIIMGDMNIDLTKLSTNNDIELYFNTLTCHNFESHINSPTRVQYNTKSNTLYSATLIDYIFSNLAEYECIAGNILYADSDHYANFLSVSKLKDNHAAKRVNHPLCKRNYSSIDVYLLLSDFNNVDWNINVLNKNITLNEAVLNFTAQLDILCVKHAPLKKVPKRKVNYIYKPWITKQILPYIIAKNKLAAKRHRNPTEFRKARNFVNNLVNASRHKYFK